MVGMVKHNCCSVLQRDNGLSSSSVERVRFVLGASDVCLVGDSPTCSAPGLQGCEGLWSYDYAMHENEYTHQSEVFFLPKRGTVPLLLRASYDRPSYADAASRQLKPGLTKDKHRWKTR